ncbi:DUF3027 domain-containing protein [Nocardia asteroides]|uniref:DUF3027 domain-containing protein n=1 Tax=Nocardia asteroides TaxID=1824 RepID=UPI003F54FFCB
MSAVSVSESGVRPVLADAAEVARRALVELEPEGVGEHLGVTAEDETAATHRFATTLAGYRGWQWAVVVAAPPEAEYATVSESALLPGPDALIAPDFIPWEQRVRPGDLGPGDLLAPPADDPRLVPGYVATGDPVVDEVAREVGLGRTQVLSLEGRVEAAQRWYTEFGPDTEMAKAAPSTCGLCGFYLPLAGALRESFGVCGNAMGADGHVVHIEYGCGAHSDVVAPSGNGSPRYEAFDDHAVDIVEVVRANGASEGVPSAQTGAVADEARNAPAEPALDQETAEAEAADAAAADRAALAEGATSESPDEVVAAEQAPESAPAAESAPSRPADTESGAVRSSTEPVVAEAAASAASAPATATAAAGDDQVGESPSAAEVAASVAIEVEVPPASGPATEALSEPIAADTAAEGAAEPAAADAVAEVPAEPIAEETSGEPTANVGTQASGESASAAKSAADDVAQPGGDSVAQAAADAAGALAAAAAGDDQAIDETASAADGVAGIAAAAAVEVPPASGPAGAAGEPVDEHGSSVAR